MSKTSFVLHLDSLSILDEMPDEMIGRFLKILYKYKLNGSLPKMDFAMKIAVTPFINQFVRDDEKYSNTIEKRALAGSLGGKQKLANASKSNQEVANLANLAESDSVSDSVSVSVSVKESGKETNASPPVGAKIEIDFMGLQLEVEGWLEYKRSRKEKYKNAQSVQSFVKKLHGLSNGNKLLANQIIENSMANNYSGIFAIKEERQLSVSLASPKGAPVFLPQDQLAHPLGNLSAKQMLWHFDSYLDYQTYCKKHSLEILPEED